MQLRRPGPRRKPGSWRVRPDEDLEAVEYWPAAHVPALPLPPASRPEPWRHGRYADRAFLLPTRALVAIADPRELRRAAGDGSRLTKIAESIDELGFVCPLEVIVDQLGKIGVGDGYHRIVLAQHFGWEELPVVVLAGDRMRGYGRPARDVLAELLSSRPETRVCPADKTI